MITGPWLSSFRFRRYRIADVSGLLRTPLGRLEIWYVLLHYAWPVTSRLAALYRRLVLRNVPLVAVVGSFGKTTTTRAIRVALGRCVSSREENTDRATLPGTLFRIRPGSEAVVLEIGIDGPGQMARIAGTMRPEIAVVTSIGSEHNRSFKTLDVTRDEKAHMVRVLPRSGAAVLNGDDPDVLWMAGQTSARVITFGFGEGNQVRAGGVKMEWPDGMRFRLHVAGEEREARVRMLGRHMVYPALAAVAVAMLRGERLDDILPRLAALPPALNRLIPRPLANGAVLLCDARKSALETIHTALDVLAEIPAARKLVVLGPINEPMGSPYPHYRALGARIARIAQVAVFVDSYSRYKTGVRKAGMPIDACLDAGIGISAAVGFLRRELRRGDVALIKGRGSQKLERIALALEGRVVRCGLSTCQVQGTACDYCPMLEKS